MIEGGLNTELNDLLEEVICDGSKIKYNSDMESNFEFDLENEEDCFN